MSSGYQRSVRSQDDVAIGTTMGMIRAENQDVALHVVVTKAQSEFGSLSISLVCDGMGGLKSGKEAAAMAAASFIASLIFDHQFSPEMLGRAVRSADSAVYQHFQGKGGTTLSAVVTNDSNLSFAVHAGDSRIYEMNQEWDISQVSNDDNLRGALSAGQAIDAELGSRLIQYIGMGDELEPHIFPINASALRVLITTDGAHLVGNSMIRSVVRHCHDEVDAVRKLLNISEYIGGLDNASLLIAPTTITNDMTDNYPENFSIIKILSPAESIQIWGTLPGPGVIRQSTGVDPVKPKAIGEQVALPKPSSEIEEKVDDKPKAPPKKRKAPLKAPELDLEAPPKVSVEFPASGGETEK
jgi:serine/threonine protein phosphatase PrpC